MHIIFRFVQLEGLQHLDISDDKQFTSDVARQLLETPGILPQLVSLDVSGRKQVTDAAVRAFVEERPGMTFVGLLATDAGFADFLSGEGSLKVGARTQQILITWCLFLDVVGDCKIVIFFSVL